MPTRLARPDGRFVRLLRVEELEPRNPASTTLDVLMASVWLPFDEGMTETPLGRRVDDLIRAGDESHRDSLDRADLNGWIPISARASAEPQPTALNDAAPVPRARTWLGDNLSDLVQQSQVTLGETASLLLSAPLSGGGFGQPTPVIAPVARAEPVPTSATTSLFASGGLESSTAPPMLLAPTGSRHNIRPAAAGPVISITAETNYIPVNANNKSGSPWLKDANGDPTGIPTVRDFNLQPMRDLSGWNGVGNPPAGPPIDDPDLKELTATVVGGNGEGQIQVDVIYANANSGRIALWTDQKKTTPIPSGGFLPDYPIADFCVEGLRPSMGENDITVRVTYQKNNGVTVTDETKLTVVPFAASMQVQPGRNPATVTLLRDELGRVIGLNSGEQFPMNGGEPGSLRVGATFSSYVWKTGAGGDPYFIQDVMDVSGIPPAVSSTNGYYEDYLKHGTYPILDHYNGPGNPNNPPPGVPYYGPFFRDSSVPNQAGLVAVDTPYVTKPSDPSVFADQISSVDLTYQFRLYTVWQFDDTTIYTLATVDWEVWFRGPNTMR